MGLDSLTDRSDDTRSDEEHFNVLKRALSGDHVPRDSSGAPADGGADLGSTSFGWLGLFVQTLKVKSGAFYSQLQAASSIPASFTSYLFSALPAAKANLKIDSSGNITAPDPNLGSSPTSANFSTASTTDTIVLTKQITTRGNPVVIMVVPDTTGATAEIRQGAASSRPLSDLVTSCYRDSTLVGAIKQRCDEEVLPTKQTSQPPTHWFVDFPPAGTYTYTIQARINNISGGAGPFTYNLNNCVLVAFEVF